MRSVHHVYIFIDILSCFPGRVCVSWLLTLGSGLPWKFHWYSRCAVGSTVSYFIFENRHILPDRLATNKFSLGPERICQRIIVT